MPEELDRELKALALEEKKAQAEVIRELLEEGISKKTKKKMSAGEFFEKIASFGWKGPSDLSTNLNSYLYGENSPNYGGKKKR